MSKPELFLNQAEITRAKRRAEEHDWAKELVAKLMSDAEKALAVPLPELDWRWWDEAKAAGTQPAELYKPMGDIQVQAADSQQAARALAQAYLFKADERFARRVREIMLHFVRTYRLDVVYWDSGMTYGNVATLFLEAYQYCWDVFDSDDHETLRQWFLGLRQSVYDSAYLWIEKMPGGAFNNHYSHHKQSLLTIEFFLGLEPNIEF
ncbi:unnamed protein product, partial [marine sediment metagenome]